MRVETFDYKLAGMRKPDNFIVYPNKKNGKVVVQGDRSIAEFDPETGEGLLNWKGSNSKYFHHLSTLAGAEPFKFPPEFVSLALNHMPSSGDTLGSGIVRLV